MTYQSFTFCGKPSVFTQKVVKSSLDCLLYHRYTNLLVDIPDLDNSCEGFFIIRERIILSFYRPLDVPELTSKFLIFKNLPNCLFDHT